MKDALLFILFAACLSAGGFLLFQESNARMPPKLLSEAPVMESGAPQILDIGQENNWEALIGETVADDILAQNSDTQPVPESGGEIPAWKGGDHLWNIVLQTGGRQWAFCVYSDIEESTLEKRIGWMPSSAKPGSAGITLVMGHRDNELRVLKDLGRGDAVYFIDSDGRKYFYYAHSAKIFDDIADIEFISLGEKTLMLATCFPFHYQGSAPQVFVLYAFGK